MNRRLYTLLALASLLLPGCAGYQLGGTKPQRLSHIVKLHVPTFENETLEPRLAVLVTNAVIKQIQAGGAYEIVSADEADAVLRGRIDNVDRSQWRSVRTNTLRTRELLVRLRTAYKIVDGAGTTVHNGRVNSESYVVLDPNFQTSERQAISEAAERMALTLVNEISDGW
jgi:outer membrane lipopolysaccharide assembly protein LptE/RlpB